MVICPNCGKKNSDRAAACFNCGINLKADEEGRRKQEVQRRLYEEEERRKQEEERRKQEEQRRLYKERKKREDAVIRISTEAGQADLTEKIKINDLYEYDVVTITDKSNGAMDIVSLERVLSERGKLGWRLVNSFTNEIGITSSSTSFAGYTSGTNATIDQTILIFERCIKRAALGSNDE